MENRNFSHSGIAALTLVALMMVGIVPGLVTAQPQGAPPGGTVDAKFNSLQVMMDGTFGGVMYVQNSIQNNKPGVNPLVLSDADGIRIQAGSYFDVQSSITNGQAAQEVKIDDPEGVRLNKIMIAGDGNGGIQHVDGSAPVNFNDPDGVKVTGGSLDVTTDLKNTTVNQPVKIVDNDGLESTIVDNDAFQRFALKGVATGTGSDSGAGVYGQSEKGVGVSALSQSGFGVLAQSTSNYGVYAKTTSGSAALITEGGTNFGIQVLGTPAAGISAQGANNGVIGNSVNGIGVQGTSTSSNGVNAISVNGFGLNASSTNGTAIRANTTGGNAVHASSTTATSILSTSTSGNGLTASTVSGIGVSATSTTGTAVTGTGGINGGNFNNALIPTNAARLGTTTVGLDVSGGATIAGVLKATAIGSYSPFSISVNINSGTSGTATVSCPAPSPNIPISCNFSKDNPTLPLIINSTAINTAAKSCSVGAYNNSGSTITLTATVLCFNPSN